MEELPKIAPCPFCDLDESCKVFRHRAPEDDDPYNAVGCLNCYAQGPIATSEIAAIHRWNFRVAGRKDNDFDGWATRSDDYGVSTLNLFSTQSETEDFIRSDKKYRGMVPQRVRLAGGDFTGADVIDPPSPTLAGADSPHSR